MRRCCASSGSAKATFTISVSGVLDLGGFNIAHNGGLTLSGGGIQNGRLNCPGLSDLQSCAVSATLAGGAALRMDGPGTATLTAANTYTGGMTVRRHPPMPEAEA